MEAPDITNGHLDTLLADEDPGGEETPDDVALDLAPELEDELAELSADEHAMLATVLLRARRDRDALGALSEIDLVNNTLKSHAATDDWRRFTKAKEKVGPEPQRTFPEAERIALPTDYLPVDTAFAQVLQDRSSQRDYSGAALSQEELSTLLYRACGVRGTTYGYNRPDIPKRFVPSGGGLQCVEVYLVVNHVDGLEQGLYHYDPVAQALELLERGNFRWRVASCCPEHAWLTEASVVLFAAPQLTRLVWKYGRRSYRMAHIDTGIVAQNLHLVATGLNLPSCMVLGFADDDLNDLIGLNGRDSFTTLVVGVGRNPWEDGPQRQDDDLTYLQS